MGRLPARALAMGLLCAACLGEDTPDEPLDAWPVGESKSDSSQSFDLDAAAAHGVLRVANRTSFEELDATTGVGLNRLAAEGIVAARPFASIAELVEVRFVGRASLSRLHAYARAQGLIDPPACSARSPTSWTGGQLR